MASGPRLVPPAQQQLKPGMTPIPLPGFGGVGILDPEGLYESFQRLLGGGGEEGSILLQDPNTIASRPSPGTRAKRPPPSGIQTGAETIGGIGGGMLGWRFGGPRGGQLGTSAGTLLGGLVSGRGVQESLFDALEAGISESITGQGMLLTQDLIAPQLSGKSRRALEAGKEVALRERGASPMAQAKTAAQIIMEGTERSELQVGQTLQFALRGNERLYRTALKPLWEQVKARVPSIDIAPIERFAREHGIRLKQVPGFLETFGEGDVSRFISFDDAITVRSKLLAEIRRQKSKFFAPQTARVDLPQLQVVEKLLDNVMEQAAEIGGVAFEWRRVNRMFRTDVADRFYQGIIHDAVTRSPEEVADLLTKADISELQTFFQALRLPSGKEAAVAKEIRGRVLANIFEKTTIIDPETHIIKPAALLTALSKLKPEARDLLFGPETAKALMEFAQVYSSARSKALVAMTTLSMGAIGAALATRENFGPLAAILGLEALNEAAFFARLVVNRPALIKRMTQAILTGSEKPLAPFGNFLRIAGTQTGGGLFRQSGTALLPTMSAEEQEQMATAQQRLSQAPAPGTRPTFTP